MTDSSNRKMGKPYKVVGIISMLIVGIFLAIGLFLEFRSPAYLFINDTNTAVDRYVIGATSPGVTLQLAPGEKKLVDMPSWWGEPSMPKGADGKRVHPRYNLFLLKVVYLSEFPEDTP